MALLSKLQDLLAKTGGCLQSPLLLLIRLYWGWSFIGTGWGKLHNLGKVSSYFASLGIPAPHLNALLAASTESLGGLLLLLGLFSRFASVALTGVMVVAYATAERESLNAIFSDTDKFTGATPFLFLYAAVLVLAFGPGRLAVDSLLAKGKRT